MVLVLESAINQPVSHNTEAGFTVNVYTEVPSITGSLLHLQIHREIYMGLHIHTNSKLLHAINHEHLALSVTLPSHM